MKDNARKFLETSISNGRPIPGQSLTNSPDEPSIIEKPAEFSNPREAMLYIFNILTMPDNTLNILLSLIKKIGVIDIASMILYEGFRQGKWNPDLMLLLMEPTMYMVMALGEKAEINFVLDSEDDEEEEKILGEKAVEKIESEIGSLEKARQEAAQRLGPQSVPSEVKEVIEEAQIEPSLLEKVKMEEQSLLSREERNE
jgi:hypothetical protein